MPPGIYKHKPNQGFQKGHGFLGNENTRKKFSERMKGKNNPMYGIRMIGEKHPMFGKNHKEESKEKMRLSHLGKTAWNKDIKYTEEQKKNLNLEGLKLGQGWNKNLKGFMAGEKNNFWKNGAMKNYPKMERIRKSPEYVNLMKETKARDDYRCFWCGERGGILHSDHILPFIKYPRLRLEPQNIQTLCESCHKIKTKGDRVGIYVFN